MAAIKKISTLPPLVGIQLPAGSHVPIIIPSLSLTGFTTVKATIAQFAEFVKPHISNQSLSTTNDVIFNSVSSASLSCSSIFAANIIINSREAITKFSETINHIGNAGATIYTINHPFTSEDITMQLLERTLQPGGIVSLEVVLASMVNLTNGVNSTVEVTITNPVNATYKIVITG